MSPPRCSSARRPSSRTWPASTGTWASIRAPNSEGTWANPATEPASGVAHAVVGERDLLAELDHLELVHTAVAERLPVDTEVRPFGRVVAVVGEGQRDVAAVGQQHAGRFERRQDHLLGIGEGRFVE